MKIIAIAASLALLTGCQTTRRVYEPPHLASIPASLKQACRSVVDIPDRDLTQDELVALWAKDRKALGVCMRRHRGLADAASALEKQGQK